MRFRLRHICYFAFAMLSAFALSGCTCCAYLNHMFNAERAYDEAGEMRKARQDSLPADSDAVATGAMAQKYDRVIEKGSRVLERFPDNRRQTANAVFLIAQSFRYKGEWAKAITKYDEFERYFSDHDSMPAVEYGRAYCLYKNGDYDISISVGIVAVDSNGQIVDEYPKEGIRKIREFLDENKAVDVTSVFLSIFGIGRMVVTRFSLKQETASNRQTIEVRALSDEDYVIKSTEY